MKHASASLEGLTSALSNDHEVPRTVSTQIMSWFGELKDGRWKMDIEAVVREVGLGILRNHRASVFTTTLNEVANISISTNPFQRMNCCLCGRAKLVIPLN